MQPLNFPDYPFDIEERNGKFVIFDSVRSKWVPLLPEEWVRQHVIQFLHSECEVPMGLMAIEKGFRYQNMPRRADIIVHDRKGVPALMVECKAPNVTVDQGVFDQVARYNRVVRARYLFVTNGLQHYCSKIDWRDQNYLFVDTVPHFSDL